jgi:acetylornithine deacetylase/succinyl-diaminopimelate desuccinylase-like protein
VEAEIQIPTVPRRSYTGLTRNLPADNPAFSLPPGHPALRTAASVLEPVLGESPPVDVWRFATDGGHFSQAGLTVIGFGPGDETLAHTVDESIEISALETALDAYEALARDWPQAHRAAARE